MQKVKSEKVIAENSRNVACYYAGVHLDGHTKHLFREGQSFPEVKPKQMVNNEELMVSALRVGPSRFFVNN